MERIKSAGEAVQRAESQVRSLLAAAASSGDYDSVVALAGIARGLRNLLDSVPPSVVPGVGLTVEDGHGKSSTSKAEPETPNSTNRKRASASYPRFVREGEMLVKIGWSKRTKSEYEHKAPHSALLVLARALQRLGTNGKRVTMESLLPLRHSADGSEIPTYQAYLSLAWLRWLRLIKQHGRQGYSITRGADLPSLMEKQWELTTSR